MRNLFLVFLLTLLLSSIISISFSEGDLEKNTLVEKFKDQKAEVSESELAFNIMMKAITHERCINCHPTDNVPKQGSEGNPHRFEITRINVDAATNCNTCHQASNNDFSGVPGAPHWSLAPESMGWQGLSKTEIARIMMDPATNGNRSAEDILHHLTEDELVLWAWEPGVDANGVPRETPPVSREDYIAAVKKWIALGAQIPSE